MCVCHCHIPYPGGVEQNVISEHSIHNISYSAQDPTDQRVFAYITKETGSSFNYCHVFMVHDKVWEGEAIEIIYHNLWYIVCC